MTRAHPVLLLVATMVMLAFNLRIAPTAIGPVLPQLSAELGMSDSLAGVLTSLPGICFIIFGLAGGRLSAHIGIHLTLWLALGLNILGQVARNLADTSWLFLIGTILALGGIGLANVMMPPLVKRHFPQRTGVMTSLYSAVQAFGVVAVGSLTAPLAVSMNGWQGPFWIWAGTAAAALIPLTSTMLRYRGEQATGTRRLSMVMLAKTRVAWLLAIFFGTQSAQAYTQFGWLPSIYQEAGFSPTVAGFYMTIFNLIVVPITFFAPIALNRARRPEFLIIASTLLCITGFTGLLIDPRFLPWLWPMFMGIGGGSFAMALALISDRTHSAENTASLSSFAQSTGYIFSIIAPLLTGVLREATGSFTAPLLLVIGLLVIMGVSGVGVVRSGSLEEELA